MLEARNLRVVDGPLARQKLKALRDENTGTPEFRQAMKELSLIMVAEAASTMPTNAARIRTPLAETEVEEISKPVCLVPVLRAGLGMLEGALALLPEATVGFMGLQRDEETAEPVEYYVNLPACRSRCTRRRAGDGRVPRRELLRCRRGPGARRTGVHRAGVRRRGG
jgi:uracil phosphoribosyltransferase